MDATGPQLDTAGIVSTVLEGILYGFSVLMYLLTVYIIVRHKRSSEWNWVNLSIANALFILSTMHIAVDIFRIWEGFIGSALRTPSMTPIGYFSNTAEFTFVFKSAIYAIHTAIGDGILIYRAWMVWKPRWWPLILPVLLWLALAAVSVGTVYTISLPVSESSNIFASRTAQWITAFYSCTLATNMIATLVLGYRLWSIEREVRGVRTSESYLMPIVFIVVETGSLYSVTLLTALICFASNDRSQYIVLDMITPIISISFYMVLLRISFVREGRRTGLTVGGSGNEYSIGGSNSGSNAGSRYPQRQVAIQISKFTQRDLTSKGDAEFNENPGYLGTAA